MQSWFTVCILNIGHSSYGQVTPGKTRYLLTSITRPYHRLRFRAHWRHMFFFKLTSAQVLVFNWIEGSSQVNLLKSGAPLLGLAKSIYFD